MLDFVLYLILFTFSRHFFSCNCRIQVRLMKRKPSVFKPQSELTLNYAMDLLECSRHSAAWQFHGRLLEHFLYRPYLGKKQNHRSGRLTLHSVRLRTVELLKVILLLTGAEQSEDVPPVTCTPDSRFLVRLSRPGQPSLQSLRGW